jgi:hypothetical protein
VNLIDMAQIMKKDFYIVIPYDGIATDSVKKEGIIGIFQNFWSAITQEESISSIRDKRSRTDNLKKENYERLTTIK